MSRDKKKLKRIKIERVTLRYKHAQPVPLMTSRFIIRSPGFVVVVPLTGLAVLKVRREKRRHYGINFRDSLKSKEIKRFKTDATKKIYIYIFVH